MNKDHFHHVNNLETDNGSEVNEESKRKVRKPIKERVMQYEPGKISESSQKMQKDIKQIVSKFENNQGNCFHLL